jgi:hypothetical protein
MSTSQAQLAGRRSYLGQSRPRALRRRVAISDRRLRVRLVEPGDYEAYSGRGPAQGWCLGGKIVGHVAERGGQIVAIGVITWDWAGRAWAWYESRERLPAIILHRKAKAMLALLRKVGEPSLYVFRNPSEPGAATAGPIAATGTILSGISQFASNRLRMKNLASPDPVNPYAFA